ncbi:MAG: putative lyase [Rhodobacteraceae bacterium HLUCCA08]|nr:MAG: putative lyase [Rhodobacteraceae bacterium HLUCCA08]
MKITALDHVQRAMPDTADAPARARRFHGRLLGLSEVQKPAALAGRGGLWFETGALRLHLGVETPFRPMRKAHPGLQVDDLDRAGCHLDDHGVKVTPDCDLPGSWRVHVFDPFGNRIELLQRH